MAKKEYFISTVNESGKISSVTSRKIRDYISMQKGKQIVITVERLSKKRSLAQNALWWVYMTIIGDEIGMTKEEVHEEVKKRLLKLKRYFAKIKGTNKFGIFAFENDVYIHTDTGEYFLPEQLESIEYSEKYGSTTTLTKLEFSSIVDELIKWADEFLGVKLQSPDENLELNFDR